MQKPLRFVYGVSRLISCRIQINNASVFAERGSKAACYEISFHSITVLKPMINSPVIMRSSPLCHTVFHYNRAIQIVLREGSYNIPFSSFNGSSLSGQYSNMVHRENISSNLFESTCLILMTKSS